MSQTTEIQIQNQNGLSFRTKLNQMLSALNTVFSGTVEPTVTEADMLWFDTSVTPNVLRRRDSSNTSWEICPVIQGTTNASPSKTTPVDADLLPLVDSADSLSLKKLSWVNTKASLKTYFDTLYLSSTTPTVSSMNGGQLAGMRNKIINGAMQTDQRNSGASQTFTAGAALAYCVDRWYGFCTGANITGQRVALANGQNRYRFTGAASNTGVGFGQRIEAVNCRDLAGSTAALSVKLSSSSLTSITWTAYYATTTDAFGTLASPTRTQIATGTFTINSTEATYSANISVPSAAITGIEIVFTGGALLGTQTLTIGDVQLEVGSVATPFEYRSYGAELALCQRYYEEGTYAFSLPVSNSSVIASYLSWNTFVVAKRAVPTVTGTNSQGTFSALSASINGVSLGRSNVVADRQNSGTFVANSEL